MGRRRYPPDRAEFLKRPFGPTVPAIGPKGPTVKAANTRNAVAFLKDLANTCLKDESDPEQVAMHNLLKYVDEYIRLVYAAEI